MKKSIYFIFVLLILISCKQKKVETEEESIERFNKTVAEIKEKQRISELPKVDNSNLNILDCYEVEFYSELSYILYNGDVYFYSFDKNSWEKDYTSSFLINQNGFLIFKNNNNETLLLDHNICSVCDSEFEDERYLLNDRNLISLSSDGYYSETLNGKLVEYKIEGLKKCVMNGFEKGDNPLYTNPIPFVTKKGNSGIGEIIVLKCKNPQTYISILPGYVNTNRQDLFYKNNRPKKIEIRDMDSEYRVIVSLADVALFQRIELKKSIKNFEIEILEVYKGSKYDDTCISGLQISDSTMAFKSNKNQFLKSRPTPNADKSYGSEIRNGVICAIRNELENPDYDIQFPKDFDINNFWKLKETNNEEFISYYDEMVNLDVTGTFDNYYIFYKLIALLDSKKDIEEIKRQMINHRITVGGEYRKKSDENQIFFKSQNEVTLGIFDIKLVYPINELADWYHYIFNGVITDCRIENDEIVVYIDNASLYIDNGF